MIDKIYSKKIIFNHILMTIAPSVKSYLPGPQRGGGGQYMMQSWTRKYIVKSLKCLYMYLWNKKFVIVEFKTYPTQNVGLLEGYTCSRKHIQSEIIYLKYIFIC